MYREKSSKWDELNLTCTTLSTLPLFVSFTLMNRFVRESNWYVFRVNYMDRVRVCLHVIDVSRAERDFWCCCRQAKIASSSRQNTRVSSFVRRLNLISVTQFHCCHQDENTYKARESENKSTKNFINEADEEWTFHLEGRRKHRKYRTIKTERRSALTFHH